MKLMYKELVEDQDTRYTLEIVIEYVYPGQMIYNSD